LVFDQKKGRKNRALTKPKKQTGGGVKKKTNGELGLTKEKKGGAKLGSVPGTGKKVATSSRGHA